MSEEIVKAIDSLKEKMGDQIIDGTIKFQIESIGSIVINNGEIKESDEDTDCTLSGDLATFQEIFNGEISSTAAFMSGRLKVDGSMGTAMKYNAILS